MSLHIVFAPLDKHYTVQTNCMLHDQIKYWVVWCCFLTNPLLLGERFTTSVYLVLYLFFLVLVFLVCFWDSL